MSVGGGKFLRNGLFYGWLGFSILSFLSCFITHPILHSQKNRTELVEVSCVSIERKTDRDTIGNNALYPDRPSCVEFTFDCTLNCKKFMHLTSVVKNDLRPLVINVDYDGTSFDCYYDAEVDPKISRNFEFTCEIDKLDEELFDKFWNSTQPVSSCTVNVKQATISINRGTFFAFYYYLTLIGTICFLAGLGGILIGGIIALIVNGYISLPSFVKVILWIFLFPILIFAIGTAKGVDGNVISGTNKIYDDNGKVVGYFDTKTNTYRDSTGRIRSYGWWKKR